MDEAPKFQAVVVLLNHLFEAYRSDRYRISILLQKDYYTDQLSNNHNPSIKHYKST